MLFLEELGEQISQSGKSGWLAAKCLPGARFQVQPVGAAGSERLCKTQVALVGSVHRRVEVPLSHLFPFKSSDWLKHSKTRTTA